MRRVMLPRVFPEGTSREGGTRLCREGPGLDAALHRARHMTPKASSTRDSTQRDGKAGRSDDWVGAQAEF